MNIDEIVTPNQSKTSPNSTGNPPWKRSKSHTVSCQLCQFKSFLYIGSSLLCGGQCDLVDFFPKSQLKRSAKNKNLLQTINKNQDKTPETAGPKGLWSQKPKPRRGELPCGAHLVGGRQGAQPEARRYNFFGTATGFVLQFVKLKMCVFFLQLL